MSRDGAIYTRRCPFHGCKERLLQNMFACRHHWFSLPRGDRDLVYESYAQYLADRISLEELREAQQAILGKRGTAKQENDPS